MLTTLTLAALLAPAPAQPAGDLKFSNIRWTIGELGGTREQGKLLPGDIIFIAFDIEGLTIEGDGVTRYTMMMEVVNAAGVRVLPRPDEPKPVPQERVEFVPLRGNRLPARAFITIGLDEVPGTYTIKLTVADPKTKANAKLEVKFEVVKKDFGIVAVFTSHDQKGEISAPNTGQVGQLLFVHFSVASFERDPKTKQPDVVLSFQVFDDKNQPTLKEPLKVIQDAMSMASVAPIKESDGMFRVLPFPLYLNRPGKFTLEITAEDRVSKKKFTYKLPVTVAPAN